MDMLRGSLSGNIIRFALPLAGSSMLQQLFNAADTAIVGRFDGRQALAAVGSNTMIISLFVNMFVGLSIGANVVIAKYVGQRQEEKIKKTNAMIYGNSGGKSVIGQKPIEEVVKENAKYAKRVKKKKSRKK